MDLEKLKERFNADKGYMRFNGMELTVLTPGYCEVRAPMSQEKTNPHGIAHGGYLYTLCDIASGIAATTKGWKVVGRTASIHYLRPGTGTYFLAKSNVIQSGRHMVLGRVDVFDDHERLVATADVEMVFLKDAPAL